MYVYIYIIYYCIPSSWIRNELIKSNLTMAQMIKANTPVFRRIVALLLSGHAARGRSSSAPVSAWKKCGQRDFTKQDEVN